MSIRTKVLGMVDVMMRVPPILIIDEILKIGMGLPTRFYPNTDNIENSIEMNVVGGDTGNSLNQMNSLLKTDDTTLSALNQSNSTLEEAIQNATLAAVKSGVLSNSFSALLGTLLQNATVSDVLSITSIKFLVCLLGFMCASLIFLLWTRHLVMVYMFVISFGLTFLSYWSNMSAIAIMEKSPCIMQDILSLNTTRLLDTGGVAMSILPHIVAQWFMGTLFAYMHLGPRYSVIQKSMPFIFVSPILLATLPLPARFIKHAPIVADLVPLLLTKITLLSSGVGVCRTIYNSYQYAVNFVSNFGLSALIENEWQRLNVPCVLRVFWTIRISQELISLMLNDAITMTSVFPTTQKLLVDGCDTLTAVLGMTAVISVICHYIGKAFQWYLLTFDNDEEKSLGTVSAVLFYILALQTGLTSLAPEKRFIRLCRNLCLLLTALLHFLHNIVSPILMSLSAARNPSRKRHLRALSVCGFLVIAPICLLSTLWTRHSPSTWLLAVTAFSVEVIVKVLVSLATYSLFLLDARRQTFWEKLDDYLYYVRAFGNSVEFCFGILLFFNGAWILLFESAQNATGGAIRAIMMCIHAYFNIWCEARAGWSVFIKRRSAVHKISALPEATTAQLQEVDDVCAICYQEMYSAKITRCRHFFHGVCLRKWLYVQDRCPLCHEIMMYSDKPNETEMQLNPQAAQIGARFGRNVVQALQREGNIGNLPMQAQNSIDTSTAMMTPSGSMSSLENASVAAESSSSSSSTATVVLASTASNSTAQSLRIAPNIAGQN